MGDRHMFSDLHSRGHGHSDLPMDYINRMLNRHSRSTSRPYQRPHSRPPPPPAASPQTSPRRQEKSSAPRQHMRKHHRLKMTSFTGPWTDDVDALKKAVQSMPDQYKSSFSSASNEVLEKVCDPEVLHVWETDSDIDNMLQLTSVIAKLCNLGTRKEKGANASDGAMVIIAEEKSGRNNFARICQLVEHLTCANGKKHLDGTVAAFGTIVVVIGWNNSIRSDNTGKEVDSTVKRINIAIERVFKMSSTKKELIWHHGPVVHFLLTWINKTSSTLRSALSAISITGSLNLTDSVKPSPAGRANTLPDLTCLETYARKLDIPILFLDPASQLLNFPHLASYMYYFAYYINTFLPSSLSRPHLHKAQDSLVTFAFQILGASKAKYGETVVKAVKAHLDPGAAKKWARQCVDARNYEKSKCRAAGAEQGIHRAVQIADSPFSLFFSSSCPSLPAFSRLAVGPAALGSIEFHTAAPVNIDFSQSRMRPANPATCYILLPAHAQDKDKVTHRTQGLMMAVLERVRQEKGNPDLASGEAEMWAAVRKACEWAFNEAKSGMPKGVGEKVKFVREKLGKGTWGCVMNGSQGGDSSGGDGKGISEAARANRDAVRAYGAGGSQFGQVHGFGGQPQQQQMGFGQHGFRGQPQHFAQHQTPQIPFAQPQQGMAAPPNSPGVGQPMPQQGMFAPPQVQGHGFGALPAQNHGYGPVRMIDDAYAQVQGVGGGGGGVYTGPPPPIRQAGRRGGGRGGYSQSMGGNWM
ncbi:hypothetical protein HBH43_041360 [Parastagonospora nodorum]|nr:hypothetical protein HBH43_041360 [Parastagonospora nodorum]